MKRPRGKLEPIKCPLCSFESKRLTTFEKHVEDLHDLDLCTLWNDINDGPKTCQCGCGEITKFYGYKKGYAKFINGHNANKSAMGDKAEEIIQSRRNTLKRNIESGKVVVWSKGLTKETDSRVAERAKKTSIGVKQSFKNGRRQWNDGLTKNIDDRVRLRGEKLSEMFRTGKTVQWAKGKTENNDPRIKEKNDKLRERYRSGDLTVWSKGLTKETDSRVAGIWDKRDPKKEYAHIRWTNVDIIKQLEENRQIRLDKIEDYRNDRKPSLIVHCNECGWTNKVALVFAKSDRCPKCTPAGSQLQHQIAKWIETLNIKVMINVRGIIGRQEIDIYIPEKQIGIEVNGLYWHNEQAGKGSNYHEMKTDLAQNYGIKLLHVFEDEWNNNKEIIKSIIKSKLGLSTIKYDARKCRSDFLTVSDRKKFFNENHIEGDVASLISWGLFYDDELVCALSLRKPFHRNIHNESLEVARFCTLKNTNVRGGVSRLIKRAKKYTHDNNYKSLMTYVDRRFGDGHGYFSTGFKLDKITTPRFWWTDFHKRYNRFKFRADRSRNMTEQQVSEEAGVVKIWGCSNLVYKIEV